MLISALMLFAAVAWMLLRRRRAMSIVTEHLARGTFPPEAGVPQPNIHGLLWVHRLPKRSAVLDCLRRVVSLPAFDKMMSSPDISNHRWVRLRDVALEPLVKHTRVPSEAAVTQLVEYLMVQPMDLQQPLWEIYLIENTGSGMSVVVPRVHHALGDGMSMVNLLLFLTTDKDGKQIDFETATKHLKGSRKGSVRQSWGSLLLKTVAAVIKVLWLPIGSDDTVSSIHRSCAHTRFTEERKLFFSKEMNLADIKHICKTHVCTVNDVVVSLICGALRRYLEQKQEQLPENIQSRALFPVAFPRDMDIDRVTSALVNEWCLVSIKLDLEKQSHDAVSRLLAMKRECDDMKRGVEPFIQVAIQRIANAILPLSMLRNINLQTMLKHHLVFSNVPGPPETVLFAGEAVERMDFTLCNCMSQIGILSYRGSVFTSFYMDTAVIRDVECFNVCYRNEFEVLLQASH